MTNISRVYALIHYDNDNAISFYSTPQKAKDAMLSATMTKQRFGILPDPKEDNEQGSSILFTDGSQLVVEYYQVDTGYWHPLY